jgi:hypothetical protein
MRYVSIVIAATFLAILAVACDGDVPGRDVPRTVPPAHVGAAGVVPENMKPAPLIVPKGEGPIYETGIALKTA